MLIAIIDRYRIPQRIKALIRRVASCSMLMLLVCQSAFANNPSDLNLWSENINFQAYKEFLENALMKAEPIFGPISLKSAPAKDYETAFTLLAKNESGFDAVISATNAVREANFLPIYFPLDRGLLGVRLCIINPQAQSAFTAVTTHSDFTKKSLSVTLNGAWPDKQIMDENGIPVTTLSTHAERLALVTDSLTHCYSRSILEIDDELSVRNDLVTESNLLMVYPQADILYVRKGAEKLAAALQYGLEKSYADGSFLAIYDKYFLTVKEKHTLYDRKIIFLRSPLLSNKGLEAINRYGIFSFIQPETVQ